MFFQIVSLVALAAASSATVCSGGQNGFVQANQYNIQPSTVLSSGLSSCGVGIPSQGYINEPVQFSTPYIQTAPLSSQYSAVAYAPTATLTQTIPQSYNSQLVGVNQIVPSAGSQIVQLQSILPSLTSILQSIPAYNIPAVPAIPEPAFPQGVIPQGISNQLVEVSKSINLADVQRNEAQAAVPTVAAILRAVPAYSIPAVPATPEPAFPQGVIPQGISNQLVELSKSINLAEAQRNEVQAAVPTVAAILRSTPAYTLPSVPNTLAPAYPQASIPAISTQLSDISQSINSAASLKGEIQSSVPALLSVLQASSAYNYPGTQTVSSAAYPQTYIPQLYSNQLAGVSQVGAINGQVLAGYPAVQSNLASGCSSISVQVPQVSSCNC